METDTQLAERIFRLTTELRNAVDIANGRIEAHEQMLMTTPVLSCGKYALIGAVEHTKFLGVDIKR